MAMFKISLDIATRNSRLFSVAVQKTTESWFQKLKVLPSVSALATTSNLNNEQWSNLRKEIADAKTGLRLPSLDVTIIRMCIALQNLDLGKSYLKYLKEHQYDINTAIIGKYFQLLYNSRDNLTNDDKKELAQIYDELRLKYPLLDALTAESCILVISLTERWKECLELLEMIKLSCTASTSSYSAVIVAAFNNEEPETGWKIFNELIGNNKTPHSQTYISYLEYCLRNFKDKNTCFDEIGKLFQFMADHDLLPDEIFVYKLKETSRKLGWFGTSTTLSSQGVCRTCAQQLAPVTLSKEDFIQLSNTVFNKVMVGNDVYSKSSPTELRGFEKFVNKTKPYDVVIDGLNVAYKNRQPNAFNAVKQLTAVVRYFIDKNQTVLVLGRKHMLKWDKQSLSYIRKNGFLFLTDDLSEDDPCLLYATLASGPEAKFVSSDLMRQHKFLLGDVALKRLFKRWQMSRQIFFDFKREKLIVVPPLKYLPVAQKSENACWHVPYRLSDAPLTESYDPPSEWLCLKREKFKRK